MVKPRVIEACGLVAVEHADGVIECPDGDGHDDDEVTHGAVMRCALADPAGLAHSCPSCPSVRPCRSRRCPGCVRTGGGTV